MLRFRYFNPAGAHSSGLLGEASPQPGNLVPVLQEVALGKSRVLQIYYGSDYPTADGTAVRDYIHIEDLAEGHVAALRWLLSSDVSLPPFQVMNLGTGRGSSVMEVLRAFELASGTSLPVFIA